MFGSDVFDIVVGLVFVYLLASLIVSAATELIAGWLGWRAQKLLDGIRNLINSPGAEDWAQKLYHHPLIQGMIPIPTKVFALFGKKLAPVPPGPSYIPSRTFSTALIGLVQNLGPTIGNTVKTLQGLLNTIPDSETSAADIKKAVLQMAGNIPVATPPNVLDTRIKTDLQALANKISDSDTSLSQLVAGVQISIGKLSDADPAQANLKRGLQSLVPSAQQFGSTVDQLKNSLQSLINSITDYSAPVLLVKSDLQSLIKRIPGETDSAAVALELVRVFVDTAWSRYLGDIIDKIPNEKLRTALTALLQQSEESFEKFKQAVEAWFDDSMDRVSGWYKRHTQWVNLILGAALTFALNLDSVSIVRALSEDNSGLLKTVVAKAEKFVEQTPGNSNPAGSPQPSPTPTASPVAPAANSSNSAETLAHLRSDLSDLLLPIGWTSGPPASSVGNADYRQWPGLPWINNDPGQWLGNWWNIMYHHFIGWLLTIIAVSLGAPFWFDLLSKIISIRASGDPPPEPSGLKKTTSA